ncbi:flavin reductase [Nocardioides sp. AE5]|uniref:flavin reductase n=1 Tax=Nocardioides sp. AE5 TaxID=2962573 RepID=UPI0028827F64|nr:flavin reductase [Nocardioides sp. AE5]MDT0200731.1 flavin reductase [Nocardioides sp. AE5]
MADAPASIECVLHSTIEVGDSTLVLGRVVAITVRAEAFVEGRPRIDRLAPLTRLGGSQWGLPPEAISVKRPS